MNYITQIKSFWLLQKQHGLVTTDIALYFYLLEACNAANWLNPFKRNTAKILADLKMPRSTFFRSRLRLNKCGILNFRSVNGTANTTYRLADLETNDKNKYPGSDTGSGTAADTGSEHLNKNSKQKPKQVAVVAYAEALEFFAHTKNNQLLKEKFGLSNAAMEAFFKTFYDSKIDLGDLDHKTLAETARNFYYWLPKHLAAAHNEKEKSCAKKESAKRSGKEQPVRGVTAALKFAGVQMREEV